VGDMGDCTPWVAQTTMCPQGHRSRHGTPTHDRQHGGQDLIAIQFAPAHGAVCPVRTRCPQAHTGPRTMPRRPQLHHEALQAARQGQTTPAFQAAYAARAGVGRDAVPGHAWSQGTRAFSLCQTRSIGLAKTPLQHLLMAMAMNLVRVAAWLVETPRAPTRLSPFAALAGACG